MSLTPYLIIGNGQVGGAVAAILAERATVITRSELDFSVASLNDFRELISVHQPKVVINTAAYTQVDKAEEERQLAMHINAIAVGLLAEACKEQHVLLVHYSTDYVFDGGGAFPWKENGTADPVNYYGKTKLAGELAIAQSGVDHLIFRISWVYDEQGSNFVNTMLALAAEKDTLNVIADQHGAPCYAADIAASTIEITEKYLEHSDAVPSGVYHMCHSGATTWYDFALEIFNIAQSQGVELKIRNVKAIATSEYPTPAERPKNSRMDTDKLRFELGVSLPAWKDGLTRCLRNKFADQEHAA